MTKHTRRLWSQRLAGLRKLNLIDASTVVVQGGSKPKGKPRLLTHKKIMILLVGLMSQYAASAANTWQVGPIYIQMLAVIVAPLGSHIPGNTEVRIRGGYTIPAGTACSDTNYITTLKTVLDNNRGLLTVLTSAQITNQPVYLWLTDDPTYTAFPGRCSIVAAQLGN